MNRWSFNANANALGNIADYEAALTAWQPTAQLLMNGLDSRDANNSVVRLSKLLMNWGGITVYRPYDGKFEGRPWDTPVADHIAFLKRFNAPWLWFNVGNECKPDGLAETRQMCRWFADLIEAAIPEGLRLVVWNCGVGTFQREWVEGGWYDDLLNALARHAHRKVNINGVLWPQFMLGSHSAAYWHGLPMVHAAGRNPDDLIHPERLTRDKWPTFEQIFDADTSDNWILFRDWWFVERTRKLQKAAGVNVGTDIEIMVTEAGPEDLGNIRKQFPAVVKKIDDLCGRKTRGAPTLLPYLAWALGMSSDEALCECFYFVEQRAPQLYRAFLWFSWTFDNNEPDRWRDGYNAAALPGVIARYPQFVKEHSPTVPVPLPLPVPPSAGDPRYTKVILKTTGGVGENTNVREYPSVDSRSLLKFAAQEARIIPLGMLTEDEKHHDQLGDTSIVYWIPVIISGIQGWVRLDAIEIVLFEPPKPPLPSPPDDEEPPTTPSEPSELEILLLDLERAHTAIGVAFNNAAIAHARLAEYHKRERNTIRESRLAA